MKLSIVGEISKACWRVLFVLCNQGTGACISLSLNQRPQSPAKIPA